MMSTSTNSVLSPRSPVLSRYIEGEIETDGKVVLGVMETQVKKIQTLQNEHKIRSYKILATQVFTIVGIALLAVGTVYALNLTASRVLRLSMMTTGFVGGPIFLGIGIYFIFHSYTPQIKSRDEINDKIESLFQRYSFPCILVRKMYFEPELSEREKKTINSALSNFYNNQRRLGFGVYCDFKVTLLGGNATFLRSNVLHLQYERNVNKFEHDFNKERKEYTTWLELYGDLAKEMLPVTDEELRCVLALISITTKFHLNSPLLLDNTERKQSRYEINPLKREVQVRQGINDQIQTIKNAKEMRVFLESNFKEEEEGQ